MITRRQLMKGSAVLAAYAALTRMPLSQLVGLGEREAHAAWGSFGVNFRNTSGGASDPGNTDYNLAEAFVADSGSRNLHFASPRIAGLRQGFWQYGTGWAAADLAGRGSPALAGTFTTPNGGTTSLFRLVLGSAGSKSIDPGFPF